MPQPRRHDLSAQAVGAGVSACLVGYASSVAVVVAGLTAVGASTAQVSSALLALGVGMAVTSVLLSVTTRVPVAVVWSTPGLALLAGLGDVDGGLPVVLGGLVVAGLLLAVTGLVPPLSGALQRLPAATSSAVLAGVLLPFCLAPATALADRPLQVGVLWLAWLAALRWAPRAAAPATLGVLLVLVAGDVVLPAGEAVVPVPVLVAPSFTLAAVLQVALPVYLVTMAAQNLVGAAVLVAHGYRPPLGAALVGTGVTSALLAPLGAPTSNLAAITGALTAGPAAHPDRSRRWVAAAAAGVGHLGLALVAPLAAAVVTQAPTGLVLAAAGLALLPTFTASAHAALEDQDERLPAAVVVLVTASGVSLLGLGSAPLGLVVGLALRRLLRRRPPPPARHAADRRAGA
ncbi:benzoate/H(+) symporter BenE family transporter [Pseudokineococcus sp. 1T1Z-3]|uniref:benzoate/H(+) symporter BenE family transporter n=1 Tax=Pseudokineococcus sp. 1T1Z-3 TaxID=3132745 RepID=UPI0030A418EE